MKWLASSCSHSPAAWDQTALVSEVCVHCLVCGRQRNLCHGLHSVVPTWELELKETLLVGWPMRGAIPASSEFAGAGSSLSTGLNCAVLSSDPERPSFCPRRESSLGLGLTRCSNLHSCFCSRQVLAGEGRSTAYTGAFTSTHVLGCPPQHFDMTKNRDLLLLLFPSLGLE